MEYQIGLPETLRGQAAVLYDEAFRKKFAPIVTDRDQRISILTDSICPAFAIVALDAGRLAGLVGFYEGDRSFTSGGTAKGLIKRLGWLRGLRAAILFSLFHKKPSEGVLRMDGIIVDPTLRGKGIGSELLDLLTKYALDHGWKQIRLDVVDTNPKARHLYERKGFVAVHTYPHPYLTRLMGFGASTMMVKYLDRHAETKI